MNIRVRELCRRLKPVLGRKIDGLWAAYLADSDPGGRADIEQTLELLAAKHLGLDYQPDRSPFPPPPKSFAESGDVQLGKVSYGNRDLYPFFLQSPRLKEHILVSGRSGSGKTNLTFVLMQGIMERGIKVVALDWKRGYRDLLPLVPDLRVYTIGRGISPFRFNPLIPPQGCEPGTWIKLIVDVIASAYLGGEGVISLLVSGLHHLYSEDGVFDGMPTRWPTILDLLAWLRTVKLRGRAAMWQASAERILLAMTYGEFGAVVNTQDNSHVAYLLDDNVVLEMDGLASASDRAMFSEALTLYLYRYRLAQGPRAQLTNLIVLEEAHHILARKALETKESVLETSIRMIRQYGIGYVFVDQSASLLSKVAFANSYATIALSQKLRADVQTISSAMNLTDEQRDALSTLPVGSAVVRLADEHPEAFLVKIPRCNIREGSVSDDAVQRHMAACSTESRLDTALRPVAKAVPDVPLPDKISKTSQTRITHPPSPSESGSSNLIVDDDSDPPKEPMSREAIRFLTDVASRPLSTTVSRYQRLHLSRRRGNAIRQDLVAAGLVQAVPIATRSGQIVLHQLTEDGRAMCDTLGIDAAPRLRASLEHSYWASKIAHRFEKDGYEIEFEHHIKGDGTVDVVAQRGGKRVAIEVETGKSDIKENLSKLRGADFDRVVLVATSASAVAACQRALNSLPEDQKSEVEMLTWLDVS
ncbi:MAG: ATP-binding protein [Planctomycetes bacterium]|nr:ATP-binding protein [Planctomycetota bacterium]